MRLRKYLSQIRRYPSVIIGLFIIGLLIFTAIAAVIIIPYEEAIILWRGGDMWAESPRNARPLYVDWFTRGNLPRTEILDSRDFPANKTKESLNGVYQFEIMLPLNYQYDGFPKEMNLFFEADFAEVRPNIAIEVLTPDGRQYKTSDISITRDSVIRMEQRTELRRQMGNQSPRFGIFADPEQEERNVLKGEYQFIISGYLFGTEDDIDLRLVSYGQVHGFGGTDHRRRDLGVALLWGTPVALMFGVLAAVGANITTFIISAVGVWYGGLVDSAIQRVTEVNMIIPTLPLLILIGMFYSRSLWVMLAVVIIKGVFGPAIKTYRAMFLQVKELPFIEAAEAYGTSNRRIIFFYMLPKIIPTLIPQFVTVIPTFVFLEASLAVLGLGDPVLPTWGKMLNDALSEGALFMGHFYWVLQPAILLIFTGLGFAMTGFALDRILNPRLRRR